MTDTFQRVSVSGRVLHRSLSRSALRRAPRTARFTPAAPAQPRRRLHRVRTAADLLARRHPHLTLLLGLVAVPVLLLSAVLLTAAAVVLPAALLCGWL